MTRMARIFSISCVRRRLAQLLASPARRNPAPWHTLWRG
jgi:hypothetical protein